MNGSKKPLPIGERSNKPSKKCGSCPAGCSLKPCLILLAENAWASEFWALFSRFHHYLSAIHLEGVVADARAGGADSLCRRLSKKLLSTATVSYNNARQRLPLAFLTEALTLQAAKILGLNPKA